MTFLEGVERKALTLFGESRDARQQSAANIVTAGRAKYSAIEGKTEQISAILPCTRAARRNAAALGKERFPYIEALGIGQT